MKKEICLAVSVAFSILALDLGAKTVMAQDVVKLAPDVKVLLENDRVRVLESTLKPGEKEPMHSHPSMVAYFLSPTTMQITLPDGKTVEKKPPAGKVIWSDPVKHAIENVGETVQRVLVIELKQ